MIQIQIQNLADVPEALSLLTGEVKKVKDAINEAGATALRQDRRRIAREALDYADRLDDFITKIEALGAEWTSLEASIATATPEAREIVRAAGGTRTVVNPPGPKTGLKATFPDGTILHDPVAAVTFATAIDKIGPARVATLGIRLSGEPLVTKERGKFRKHPGSVEAVSGGWLVNTYCDTERKIDILERISSELGLGLVVVQMPGVYIGAEPVATGSETEPGGRDHLNPESPFPYKVGQVVQAVFPVLQGDSRLTVDHVDWLLSEESTARFSLGGRTAFKPRTGTPDETRDANGHHRYYPGLPLRFYGCDVWLCNQFLPPSIDPVLAWLDEIGVSREEVLDICNRAYATDAER